MDDERRDAILEETRELEVRFAPGEIETLIWRADPDDPAGTDSAIRVVHTPTGMTVDSQVHSTQIENKLEALKALVCRLEQAT